MRECQENTLASSVCYLFVIGQQILTLLRVQIVQSTKVQSTNFSLLPFTEGTLKRVL